MKNQKLVTALVVVLANLLIAAPLAFAKNFQVLNVPTNLNVSIEDTVSFGFGKQYYVKNLVVQAEGISQDSTIEVMVNGNVKGTIYAPGRDPSYVVTVEERTASVEFRHRAGGRMKITRIVATVQKSDVPGSPPDRGEIGRTALALSERAIQLVIELVPYCSLEEEAAYLVPIKISAGKLKSMVNAHGFYSEQTRAAMKSLQANIEKADPFLLLMMESESLFDQIVEIYQIKESIKDLLQ